MKYKQITIRILCILALLFISVGTIFDFSLQLHQGLRKETFRILADVSEDYNKAVADRTTYTIKTLEVLAGGLSEMQDRPKQDIMRILQNTMERVEFAKTIVCDTAGNSCSNDGTVENITHCN
ncbi:MAG: hypothetical protein RRY21_00635, partial [Oscillospiraceae bacterium]